MIVEEERGHVIFDGSSETGELIGKRVGLFLKRGSIVGGTLGP